MGDLGEIIRETEIPAPDETPAPLPEPVKEPVGV